MSEGGGQACGHEKPANDGGPFGFGGVGAGLCGRRHGSGVSGILALAQWSSVSSLQERRRQTDFQTGGPKHQPERRSPRRLFLWRLPSAVHRDGRNSPRTFARSDLKVADGSVPSGLVEEIPQCQSDSPDDRSDLQDGLVHVSPHPLCHDTQPSGGAEVEGHGGSG